MLQLGENRGHREITNEAQWIGVERRGCDATVLCSVSFAVGKGRIQFEGLRKVQDTVGWFLVTILDSLTRRRLDVGGIDKSKCSVESDDGIFGRLRILCISLSC